MHAISNGRVVITTERETIRRPDCEVCGKPFSAHGMGAGIPVCPIVPAYRPKKDQPHA